MTASPIWNIKNPLQSLKDLEHNMLSKVIGVRENLDELAENSPRPNEVIFLDLFPTQKRADHTNNCVKTGYRLLSNILRSLIILLTHIQSGRNLRTKCWIIIRS